MKTFLSMFVFLLAGDTMGINIFKMDKNLIISFNRVKRDVFSLLKAKEEHSNLLEQINSKQHNFSVRIDELYDMIKRLSDVSIDIIELNNRVSSYELTLKNVDEKKYVYFEKEMSKIKENLAVHNELLNALRTNQKQILDKLTDNNKRMNDLSAYTESIKASTSTITNNFKKITVSQNSFMKSSASKEKKLEKSYSSLLRKIVANKEALDKLKENQKNLKSKVKKSSQTTLVAKKIVSRKNLFGSLRSNLELVEGIGPEYAKRLIGIGVKTTKQLLKQGATNDGRELISNRSGFSKSTILEWVNRVDLMRVSGVGEEYSDLLEEAGVDTVPELAQRNTENLYEKMIEINKEKNLVRNTPSLKSVKNWVSQAKKLPKIIEY